MYYIYIIYSESADKYYVGHSDTPYPRLEEHNPTDRNTYTSTFRPWIVAGLFECADDIGTAMKIEKFIKKQKSRILIEKMISGEPLSDVLAQLLMGSQPRA